MRIAQVVGFVGPAGGMLRAIVTLADSFAKAGHTTDVIYWDGEVPDHAKNSPARFVKLDIFGLSRHNVLSNVVRKMGKLILGRQFFPRVYSPFLTPQMEHFLVQRNYDAVLFHDIHYFGFHRLKSPHFAVLHNTQSAALPGAIAGTGRRLLHKAYTRTFRDKFLIAVSQSARDDLVENFGADPAKTISIYNPFDFDAIRATGQSEPSPYHRPYILGAGRCIPQKNFALLIRAYADAARNEDLVIIGDGREKRSLQRLAGQLGVQNKVHLAGFQPNPYPWFRHARLFVLSSDYEGFAMVIPEALACGTPVISTDCPSGPGEILHHCGLQDYLVPAGDASALSGKITATLAQPPDLADIEAKLNIFQADVITEQYLSIFARARRNAPGVTGYRSA